MAAISSRQARWALPFAVAALVAGGAQWSTRAAAATPDLPAITAQDLLVKVQTAKVQALSGTVRSTTALGLPALPRQGGVDWTSLLAGTQTLRVYADGASRQRVDLLGDLTQASVVHDGRTLWTWNSATRQVTRTTLPAAAGRVGSTPSSPRDLSSLAPLTPQDAAQRALAAVTPTTRVSVGRAASVAGRDAYDLRLQPRQAASLVGSVDVFVDASTGLVLRTVVTPRGGGDPAVDIGFTRLTLAAPPASAFRFSPPPGASVRDLTLPSRKPAQGSPSAHQAPQVRTFGTGWTTVVETSVPKTSTPPGKGPDANGGLADLVLRAAKPVPGGGRLLSTRLVSVLLTGQGQLYVGAVTPEELMRQAEVAAVTGSTAR